MRTRDKLSRSKYSLYNNIKFNKETHAHTQTHTHTHTHTYIYIYIYIYIHIYTEVRMYTPAKRRTFSVIWKWVLDTKINDHKNTESTEMWFQKQNLVNIRDYKTDGPYIYIYIYNNM